MSYSLMFKENLYAETEYCAVSNIEDMHDAYKFKTLFENNPYDFNVYWVRKEAKKEESKNVC